MKDSYQLSTYLKLFKDVKRSDVEHALTAQLAECYENNTLGFRIITTLINQYFIKGPKLAEKQTKKVTFQKELSFH